MSDRAAKPYQIATSIYVALIFSFYLLFFDKNGLAAISGAKAVCYYLLTLSYFAAVLVLLIVHCAQRKLRAAQVWTDLKRMPAAAWLILLYLLCTVVSALLSEHGTVWLGGSRREGVLTISLYCISFLLICRFCRPALWHLNVFAAAATAFCAICIFQMLDVNIFSLYPLSDNLTCADFNKNFIGTIGNIDFTAAFLCVAVPVFWCSILRLKEKQRFLLFLPLLLCLFVLLKISVASGIVGVCVGTLLSLPVVLPRSKKARIILLIAVAALFAAALTVIYYCKLPLKELRELRSILHGRVKDSYGSGRMYIWRATLRAMPEHFWFGTGPDTMSLANFARQELSAGDTLRYVRCFDAAHCEYLTILYHQGIFALLAYLGALGVTFVQWVRRSRENAVAAIAGAAVLCFCLQAFFNISQLITQPFFWCMFGILANAANGKNTANDRRKN